MTSASPFPAPGEGKPRPKRVSERTARELAGDALIAFVGSGGGLGLLITAVATPNKILWACGIALVALFIGLLLWRYDIVGEKPRWRRAVLFAIMVVSAVSIPAAGLAQILYAPPVPTAAIKDCKPVGPVGKQRHGLLPPGVPRILSMLAYVCSALSPVRGNVPVYLYPGATALVGQLQDGASHPWFVCWLSGPGSSAWYYTQGDFQGRTDYPQRNAWGFVHSSLARDPVVPRCPQAVRATVPN